MTLNDWLPVIIALVGAAAGVYTVYRQTRKDKVDIADQVSTAWGKLSASLENRVEALEVENRRLRVENGMLWDYIDVLRKLLITNNIKAPEIPTMPVSGKRE